MPLDDWEALWAPYDSATYANVLAAVRPEDVVLEIGAGDLRLARQLAGVAQSVIAWEIQADVLHRGVAVAPLPPNLQAMLVDARTAPVPQGVTVAVLLMRHCTHYKVYVERLRAAACRRLITNTRWRMGVEVVDLSPAEALERALAGWYTCRRCGAVGFLARDASEIDDAALDRVTDVEGCPRCDGDQGQNQPDGSLPAGCAGYASPLIEMEFQTCSYRANASRF